MGTLVFEEDGVLEAVGIPSEGSFIVQLPTDPAGFLIQTPIPIVTGGAAGYDFNQPSPSLTWTINHNLGYKPAVDIFSTGGVKMVAEVLHVSGNQTVVTFKTATAGFARLI